METITISLVLLLAVVISGILARLSPIPVPLPLVQIGFGALIAATTGEAVSLNPEIFFLLLLPPLLFLDGWRIPKEELFHDKGTILELAFGLVIFTVVGMGFFIHWMIPTMPLPVAFALAAILSPTDPIAVSSIAARVPIPKRMMHILEGESLLNDASGLVCMRFAVAAALTGGFSLMTAAGTFLWLALGGIAIGVGVTWSITYAKGWITRRIGEDTGAQILISLLIPFGAYLAAEHLHASGILAAVAAGITMSYAESGGQALATTRVRRTAVWDTVQFTVNGIIFVLLGEQLPKIASSAAEVVRATGRDEVAWLAVYVVATNFALAVLRFGWVWASLRFTIYRRRLNGGPGAVVFSAPSWRLVAAMSLAGVRGAITLAGVMTLPLVMLDGSPFPARDVAVFIAAGVIIVSLAASSIGLPFLLKGLKLPPEPSHHKEEERARALAAEAAIKAIELRQHAMSAGLSDVDRYVDVAAQVMDIYRKRIDRMQRTAETAELAEEVRKAEQVERELRLAGLRAEREELYRLARNRLVSEEIIRKLVRDIDLAETRLLAG
ncbi:Na+/H+ antiporter [Pedomonas sp. V897]|uniref:Na+/H+ antiporter n=1 Tax=Pedomonas sp. V897 TaxID=3446482 RepID=UPI003EDEEC08